MNYYLYSLNCQSEIPFEGLMPGTSEPEFTIRYGTVDYIWPEGDQERLFIKTSDGLLLSWRQYASFLIKNGDEIIVHPMPGCDASLLRHLILGPVLSLLLYQRGYSVFHASTIEIGTDGIAFLAAKGYGKSTQAAAFLNRGKRLVSDDLLVLKYLGREAWSMPGVPLLKLWPESMKAVGKNPEQHLEVKPNMEKRVVVLNDRIVHQPVKIHSLYFLELGQDIEIQNLTKHEALQYVFQHWYGALFQGEMLPLLGVSRQFQECIKLVDVVPSYLLKRPVSLSLLSEICQAVECHVYENNSSNS